jgi:HD-like signal output (HDOD) protein
VVYGEAAAHLLSDTPVRLVNDPPPVQGPAIWELGGVSPSVEFQVVRTALMAELSRLAGTCDHEGDRAFVMRLLLLVGKEKLDIPPFPDVARRLDRLLRSPQVAMHRVIKLLEGDPALVQRVWSRACGAAYIAPPPNFQSAVTRLGFDALWRIAMSTCMYDGVFRVRGFQGEVSALRAHGIVVGEVAAWLATGDKGQAYLAGLLHDVGKLIVLRAASARPDEVVPSPDFVMEVVTQYHAALGVAVAEVWKLGDDVTTAIGFHHAPELVDDHQRMARYVQIADIATHTAAQTRAGIEGGGFLALLAIVDPKFDAVRAIGKAHHTFEELGAEH